MGAVNSLSLWYLRGTLLSGPLIEYLVQQVRAFYCSDRCGHHAPASSLPTFRLSNGSDWMLICAYRTRIRQWFFIAHQWTHVCRDFPTMQDLCDIYATCASCWWAFCKSSLHPNSVLLAVCCMRWAWHQHCLSGDVGHCVCKIDWCETTADQNLLLHTQVLCHHWWLTTLHTLHKRVLFHYISHEDEIAGVA